MFDFTEKLNFHQDKVNEALKDQVGSSLSTVFLDLLTNICNFDCVFCDGKRLYSLEDNSFSKARLDKMVEELVQLKIDSVILVGEGGEPLIHPYFTGFSKKMLKAGVKLGLYTNGSIVRKAILTTLADFDFVRISLNAGTRYSHERIHRYNNKRTFNNVLKFISECSKLNKNSVGVSFVIIRENVEELYLAAKIAKNCGADYIEFKPAYGYDYSIDKNLYEINTVSLIEQIELSRTLENADFKIVLNNQLNNFINNNFENDVQSITLLQEPRLCITSKLRMVVSPTGCYLCTPKRSKKYFSYGNPKEKSLVDIWYSKEHQSLTNELCSYKCTYHEQNKKLLELKESNQTFTAISNLNSHQKSFL